MNENKPLLSICIGEYRGSKRCFELVKKILTYKGNEIEVVVNDNASDDDTMGLLYSIDDERLKLYQNEENVVPMKNWYSALSHGKGIYLLQLNDSDYLHPEYLKSYLTFLRRNEYAVIFNYYTKRFYKSGPLNALECCQLAVVSAHPSHYVFKRDLFLSAKVKDVFSGWTGFPHVISTFKIIQGKKGYNNKKIPLITPAKVEDLSNTTSRTQNMIDTKGIESPFSFQGSLRDSLVYLSKIDEYVDESIRLKLIIYMYYKQVESATCGYRIALSSWVGKRYHLSGKIPEIPQLLRWNEKFCNQMDQAISQMSDLQIVDKKILKLVRYVNRIRVNNRFSNDMLFIKYIKEIPIKLGTLILQYYCRE